MLAKKKESLSLGNISMGTPEVSTGRRLRGGTRAKGTTSQGWFKATE